MKPVGHHPHGGSEAAISSPRGYRPPPSRDPYSVQSSHPGPSHGIDAPTARPPWRTHAGRPSPPVGGAGGHQPGCGSGEMFIDGVHTVEMAGPVLGQTTASMESPLPRRSRSFR